MQLMSQESQETSNIHWSISPMVHWSIMDRPLVHWSIGPLVHWFNVKCQISKIKCHTSRAPPVIFASNRSSLRHDVLLFIQWWQPLCKCPYAQIFKCPNAQIFKCSNVQMFRCSNVQMFKWSNHQICKCSNDQIFKCSNSQMFQCSNV